MTLHIKQGGSWETVGSPNLSTKVGGVWKDVTNGYVHAGGTWQEFYTKSDPVTYAFTAVSANSTAGFTSWKGSSDLKVGSYGFGDRVTYLDFRTSVDTEGSGLTLAAALAIRPVVDACSVYLHRDTGGYGTITVGQYHIGVNTGGYGSGTANISATNRSTHPLGGANWSTNSARLFTGLGNLATNLDNYPMVICNNTTPSTSGGGNDTDYSVINTTLYNNKLWVTLDYV